MTKATNQPYEEKLMTLSDIRRLDGHIEGTIRLAKSDVANIVDALNEWDLTIGAKELADDEVGLDYQRWVELKLRHQQVPSLQSLSPIRLMRQRYWQHLILRVLSCLQYAHQVCEYHLMSLVFLRKVGWLLWSSMSFRSSFSCHNEIFVLIATFVAIKSHHIFASITF
jgi:hypothetical protein